MYAKCVRLIRAKLEGTFQAKASLDKEFEMRMARADGEATISGMQ